MKKSVTHTGQRRYRARRDMLLFGAAVLTAGVLANMLFWRPSLDAGVKLSGDLVPEKVPDYRVISLPIGDTDAMVELVSNELGYDDYVFKKYDRMGQWITVYVAFWRANRRHFIDISTHAPDNCWVQNGWLLSKKHTKGDAGFSPPPEWRDFSKGDTRLTVLYWHFVGGELVDYTSYGHGRTVSFLLDNLSLHLTGRKDQWFIRIASNMTKDKLFADGAFAAVVRSLEHNVEPWERLKRDEITRSNMNNTMSREGCANDQARSATYDALVQRYRRNYRIRPDAYVDTGMVLRHWELETQLRAELLASTPANRWEVFDRCYSRLYSELEWLNRLTEQDAAPPEVRYAVWLRILGNRPLRIYEIGSGRAELLRYLSQCGHACKATEITRERGGKFAAESENLKWSTSDGVHLDMFEAAQSFDVVISDQVIEHMHPDDVPVHFTAVRAILAPKGRYIFATPERLYRPADVSRVFQTAEPKGMHLKEYSHGELDTILRAAGFSKTEAVFRTPLQARRIGSWLWMARPSSAYLGYLRGLESALELLPRNLGRLAGKLMLCPGNAMLVATK